MGDEIAYQNKDITSKFLAENLKGKTFRVYGLNLPAIKDVRPTNIPTVQAKELRIDNLFELEDGTVAILDYESDYDVADKVKYLNYLTGVANRYLAEKKKCPSLRIVVIYTGDIKRGAASGEYNIGAVKLSVEMAFLSELDGPGILGRLRRKVSKGEWLNDEELMQFIILPLSYKGKEAKEEKIQEVVELAAQISDRGQQVFALAGLLVFTDKIIDREMANRIRRAIEMTQVARIFEEEKQQALAEMMKAYEAEKQQALAERQQMSEQLIIRMLKKGYPTKEIISLVSGYSEEDVEAIREKTEKED